MRRFALLFALLFAVACASTSTPPISGTNATPAARLEATPRHDEWAEIRQGDRTLHAYVVYPQASQKVMAVVVVHENRGLTDWVRSVADRLAEEGYIAVAPDFLSGAGPNGGRTKDFANEDAARQAIGTLPKEQIAADLRAAIGYARTIPSANGKVAAGGFCWGGARAWDAANLDPKLAAAFVFYGTGPQTPDGVANIGGPVYGFYGGADERVNATIPKSAELMQAANKTFDPVIYDAAAHAFMRAGELPDASEANKKAATEGWKRWLALLARVR
jgi:carboxymethylenebutenolidase